MNRQERAKALALARCSLPRFSGEPRFVRGLVWLAQHSPDTALTPRQKWWLDCLVYRHRGQLAGREEGFEIPTDLPQEQDYEPARSAVQWQERLL